MLKSILRRTEFGDGDVIFNNSTFKVLSLKSCHLDHYFDLRLARAELLDISDTIVRDIVDLEPYDFKIDIQVLDMSGMRIIGKLYIDWKHNNCRKVINSPAGNDHQAKSGAIQDT